MGFILGNIKGRSSLIKNNHFYDIETISNGSVSSDPSQILLSLDQLSDLNNTIDSFEPTGLVNDDDLQAPITNSGNCFAVGLNYKKHAEESNMALPEFPMIFAKYTSCIVGPFHEVELRSDMVDYEAELVAVIGKPGKDIALENAWEHVAGLTAGQDISDRAVQFHSTPPHFNLGKSFDTFGPIGPMLVSPDKFKDKSSLKLECYVNDELRQDENTNDLIFDIPYIISYLSEFLTLKTGDLIFTGTPAGVGATQGKLLKDGDVIRTTIEGIGTIENKCKRISDHSNTSHIPEFLKSRLPQDSKD
jgi:2-keto-4-pentenoate hydratase/2-oxohepta-3-ene-1,7-dioic acid hydratase in catechol pathway